MLNWNFHVWIRDYSEGTTSGKGSFKPHNIEELNAWLTINPQIETFMLSEYLPGRNLACFLLYNNGKLLKYGVGRKDRLYYGESFNIRDNRKHIKREITK